MKAMTVVVISLAALVGVSLPGRAPASEPLSIYDNLAQMKDHSVLFVAVTEAKEATTLRASGTFTLFAPTDAAFKHLDDATIKNIATDREMVRRLLRAHLVEGKYATKELGELDRKELRTLAGTGLKVEGLKDDVRVGGAKLVTRDVLCSNGVIHVIDTVLPVPKG